MAFSKIILNGTTQMDVTTDTVDSSNLLSGITATKNDGTKVSGSLAVKTAADMTVSGATVTAPAGVYSTAASKSVANGSATTPATSITANPSISVNSSTGVITATASATKSITPTVSAGYVSSGTAGTVSVSGSNTESLTTQAAQTIYPSTSDQSIASGRYLTGAQTIKGVLLTNLSADNIKKNVVVKVGDSVDDDRITAVTGTYEGGGGGVSYGTFTVTANDSSVAQYVRYITLESPTNSAVGYIPMVAKTAISSASTATRTGRWYIGEDGYMRVSFMGTSDSRWPMVTATSGTATPLYEQSYNTYIGEKAQSAGPTHVYLVSNGAVLTVTYFNGA